MRPAGRRAACLFAAALILRLGYLALDLPVPPQDTRDYDEIARNLLAGEGFVARGNWFGHQLRAWRAPLYPFFLAGVYGLGGGHGTVRVVQAVLGAATVVGVYLLTLRLRPEAALLAGALAVVYEPSVAATGEVMTETLYTALFIGAVGLAVAARQKGGVGGAAAAGALAGLAGLARPVGLLVVPALLGLAAWEAWRAGGQAAWRRALAFGVALTVGAILVVAPWTLRNAVALGALVPVATHGGFIVARSNADRPAWRQPHGWRIDRSTFDAAPGEVERDRRWMHEGLAWIGSHPGAWLRLAGERLLRFFYVFRPGYNIAFVVLLPFVAAGFWRHGREPGFRDIAAVSLASLVVFCFLLYASTRFRLPFEPLWLPLAAAAAVDARRRWGGRRFGLAAGLWIAANGAVWAGQAPLRAAVLSLLRAWGLK